MADRQLTAPPSMLPRFARAGASGIPGAARLPFIGGGGGEMPDLSLTVPEVSVDRARLAAYARVCAFDLSDTLPATYPHMLAFPLHLSLMTDGRFPLPAIGLVHIANTIIQHRPIAAGETFSLRVWPGAIERHPRGHRFAIHTELRVGEELVWEESSVNLRRGRRDDSVTGPPAPPETEGLPAAATWRLPGDLGRRYGAVSGDLNPIHVHPLSARLFGFRTAIAHGMWTLARCLAALGPQLPAALTVDAAFRRPILLPAVARFAEAETDDGISFGVRDAKRDTPHLDGLVHAARSGP